MALTQAKLKFILSYSPLTGVFIWNVSKSGNNGIGSVAGNISSQGYRVITVNGKEYRAARLAFLYMEGYFPEYEVDHVNRNKSDDMWKNLKHVSHSCNMKNRGVMRNNKSGIPGVQLYKADGTWAVVISSNKKRFFCGYFQSFKDAVVARWEAEKKHGFLSCNKTSLSYKYLSDNNLI